MKLENEKIEGVNENENKNVDEFQEHVFQQKPANAKVKASRATVKFSGQSFSLGKGRKGVYLLYNAPNNFSWRTHADRSCIFCRFFCVSFCGIVNQLFNFSVTGFCKKYSFVFHDRLKD